MTTSNKILPENFFIDDKFYSDITELMEEYEVEEIEIDDLEDDWEVTVNLSNYEHIFQMTEQFVVDAILRATDRFDDRFPEDPDMDFVDEISKAIKVGINIEEINKNLPLLYYSSQSTCKITKNDLKEWCE